MGFTSAFDNGRSEKVKRLEDQLHSMCSTNVRLILLTNQLQKQNASLRDEVQSITKAYIIRDAQLVAKEGELTIAKEAKLDAEEKLKNVSAKFDVEIHNKATKLESVKSDNVKLADNLDVLQLEYKKLDIQFKNLKKRQQQSKSEFRRKL